MLNLTGKVALVTGSSRGLGRAIAWKLAEAGADIIVNFSDLRAAADETAGRIAGLGRKVAEVQADLTEPEDIQTMIDWIGETFGRLDIVVSNVTPRDAGSLLTTTPDQFDAVMHASVRPLILLTQAARSWLAKSGGKVVAVSQTGPHAGLSNTGSAAVENAVAHLALELGAQGIHVNAIQVDGALTNDEAQANQAAGAVLFMASPLSDLVQGQTLQVHGSTPAHANV